MQPEKTFLPLVTAVYRVTGTRPHLSTVLRWCQRPNRFGNRLRSTMIGGRRLTTIEAVREFIEANTQAADRHSPKSEPNPASRRAHDAAMRELDNLGI